MTAIEFGQNGFGGFSPDEGFGVGIVFGQINIDRRLQANNRAEDAATDALSRHLGKKVLHRIEPGRRGWGEVKSPARMACQPGQHFRMFVGGVVVEDDVDRLVGGNLALDSVEEADESMWRWRCMQRPITVPSSTLRAANRMVVPCRL